MSNSGDNDKSRFTVRLNNKEVPISPLMIHKRAHCGRTCRRTVQRLGVSLTKSITTKQVSFTVLKHYRSKPITHQ